MGIQTYALRNQTLHGANLSGLVISVLPLNQVRQSILAVRLGNVEKNKQLIKDDIKKIALAKKTELNVTDKAGMGKFMGLLMKEFKGKADGDEVKKVVEELFN